MNKKLITLFLLILYIVLPFITIYFEFNNLDTKEAKIIDNLGQPEEVRGNSNYYLASIDSEEVVLVIPPFADITDLNKGDSIIFYEAAKMAPKSFFPTSYKYFYDSYGKQKEQYYLMSMKRSHDIFYPKQIKQIKGQYSGSFTGLIYAPVFLFGCLTHTNDCERPSDTIINFIAILIMVGIIFYVKKNWNGKIKVINSIIALLIFLQLWWYILVFVY